MGSPSAILSMGLGSWGSAGEVLTLGYGLAVVATVEIQTTRLTLIGTSRFRMPLIGQSQERLSAIGQSQKAVTLVGSGGNG